VRFHLSEERQAKCILYLNVHIVIPNVIMMIIISMMICFYLAPRTLSDNKFIYFSSFIKFETFHGPVYFSFFISHFFRHPKQPLRPPPAPPQTTPFHATQTFICISVHFYYIFIFILINSTQCQQIVKTIQRMELGDCKGKKEWGKYFFVMTEMCASIEKVSTISTFCQAIYFFYFFVRIFPVNFHHFHFEFSPLLTRCAVQIFAKSQKDYIIHCDIYFSFCFSLSVFVPICNVATLNFSAHQKYANKSAHATCESISTQIFIYIY